MLRKNYVLAVTLLLGVYASSCKKNPSAVDEYKAGDTTGVIKNLAEFPIGVGVQLNPLVNDPAYLDIIKQHFNSVTLENELKHASVVTNEGGLDYTKSDQLIAIADAANLSVFGHTLVDWQSTNTTYMRSLRSTTSETNVVPNSGFETGAGDVFTNWITQVATGATGNFQQETSGVYEGMRAMRVNVVTPGPFQYSIQTYSDNFSLTAGRSYTLSFYAKAAANGSRLKAVVQNTTYQEKTFVLTPNWAKYSWTFTANEALASLKFHFPEAGTFYIDAMSIPRPNDGIYAIDPVKVDTAMKRFITQSVLRYQNKITSWDVVNEPLEDGTGKIKTNPQPGSMAGDKFYFAEFLGAGYIEKAFRYANQANPNATLFLNEAKLESDGVKLDSMIKMINQLKAAGVPVHGIGLQMHLDTKNDRGGIERALQKLAATGLKIRISEMDIRVNPWNYFGYQPTEADLIAQRDLYRFVVGAYYRLVPAPQRVGITFWDPTDKYSWIITHQGKDDAPTLFDKQYRKKAAYYGVVVGLRKKG